MAPLTQYKRPQEPVRPYPYHDENVVYENKVAGVRLAGTLTIPKGAGPFPALLIIAGSGQHARDAIKGGHRTMLVLADYLTRQGIVVLRFDKRGCGESTGNFATATSADFASDTEAGIAYLTSRKEVNAQQIGVLGHSEGGVIAAMVAAASPVVAFAVMLGCPSVNGEKILYAEVELLARAGGEPEDAVIVGQKITAQLCTIIKQEPNVAEAKKKIAALCAAHLAGLTEAQKKAYEVSILREVFDLAADPPWLAYYLTFEPTCVLEKITIPVLGLFGERDLLMPAKQNLVPFAQALEVACNNDYTILLLPELNHRFQHCKIGTEHEYEELEETMAPEALKIIADWILAKTSGGK